MTRQPPKGAGRAGMKLRCAIYTRKSGEEGLEQDFNSLDAQREACECQTASNFDPRIASRGMLLDKFSR
jgi:site-specific DNA recombinase